MFDQLVQRGGGQAIRHQRVEMGASHDNSAQRRAVMEEALFCRMTGTKPGDSARPYMNVRTLDMARELLQLRGERGLNMLGPDELLRRAMHTTSDFVQLLSGTGNRNLQAVYMAAASPLKLLARPVTMADFRARSSPRLSGLGQLVEVAEHGEIKHVSRVETVQGNTTRRLVIPERRAPGQALR